MSEIEKIADQLARAVKGNAWHGPALLELLIGLTAIQANLHPIENAHSIWEIVNHITAWHKAVERRLNFEAVDLYGEDDWHSIKERSEDSWAQAVEELKSSYQSLSEKILSFPIDKLEIMVIGKTDQTFYILLHGIVQHDLYHAGQIALLKKLL